MAKYIRFSFSAQMIVIVSAIVMLILLPWQASVWTRNFALSEIASSARYSLKLVTENLNGELAKFAVQPFMLANNPSYKSVLLSPGNPQLVETVNLRLEKINRVTGAADTYLMNAQGLTVAASNWQSKKSFVGRNFSFRPYFRDAMEGRLGRYFALGTTSGKRGYYFAFPIREGRKVIGCVVVKMDVGELENAWRQSEFDIIVTDKNGVIFLSSKQDRLFNTIAPLDKKVSEQLHKSRQFAGRPLPTLPIKWLEQTDQNYKLVEIKRPSVSSGDPKDWTTKDYLVVETPMTTAGWNVHLMAKTDKVAWQMTLAFVGTLLLSATLILLGANIYQRRKRIEDRIKLQDEAYETLERRVTERTAELKNANNRLIEEIWERSKTEDELRKTQSSLVQATKLAALGQMSAGLSHEINQPLAAIGTYADNARRFIERDDQKTALDNLVNISALIKRVAKIIQNLRTYARNEPVTLSAVSLNQAIEDALGIVNQRIMSEGVSVNFTPPTTDPKIEGGEVRLQQVFVNLITNSLDAMADVKEKQLTIDISHLDGKVRVSVQDSGSGIDPEQIVNVFDPFYSTKDTGEGMGLGLSITFGIVKQFGGKITARNRDEGGAEFVVTLNRATEKQGEAA